MTHAMPPAQPVSLTPANAPGTAKKGESHEDFADTFRGQLESKSQEPPADGAAASNATPAQRQTVEKTDAAAATTEQAPETAGAAEVTLPGARPLPTVQNDGAVESIAAPAPPAEATGVPDVVAALAETPPSGAVVAAVAVPAQVAPSARGLSGQSTSATTAGGDGQGVDLGPAKSQVPVGTGRSDAGSGKEASLHSFARVAEVATAAVPMQGNAALASSTSAAQGTFQPPSSHAMPLVVDTPLANPGWGSAMAARLVWGATQGMHSATIEINPRDLGPVSVNLKVVGDEASISFVSQHALVREAVEAALPRLRELFSGDGINLGEVDISNGEGRSNGGDPATDDMQSHRRSDPQADAAATSTAHEDRPHRLDSLVDTFA